MAKRSDALVGLTLGLESAVAAVITPSGSGLRVEEVGRIGFPPGTIGPEGAASPDTVTSALRELWARARIPAASTVAVCLNHPGATLQLTTVPVMPDRELDEALHGVAEGYGIFEGADIVSDWALVERTESAGVSKLSVLLVAAKKNLVNSLLGCVAAAGIRPYVMDTLPTAAMRVLYPAAESPNPVAVVLVGDHNTYIGIFQGGKLKVSYIAGIGQVGGRKHGQALTGETEVLDGSGPRLPAELVKELRHAFRFYQAQFPQQKVEEVLLVAGGERSSEAAALSSELGVAVHARKTSDFLSCEGDLIAAADTLDALGAVGAAAGVMREGDYPLRISLAPPPPRQLTGVRDAAIAAVSLAIVLGASLIFGGNLSRQAAAIRKDADGIKTVIASDLKPQIARLEDELKIRSIQNDAIRQKVEELQRANQVRLSQVIAEIAERRPEGIWLESVGLDEGRLSITGKTTSNEAYAEFISRLSGSPLLVWAAPNAIYREPDSRLYSFDVTGQVVGTGAPPPTPSAPSARGGPSGR